MSLQTGSGLSLGARHQRGLRGVCENEALKGKMEGNRGILSTQQPAEP